MLGDLIYEEKGTTTGVRVLESENGSVKLEVPIQTEPLATASTAARSISIRRRRSTRI